MSDSTILDEDVMLQLLRGKNIVIDEYITVKSYTLGYIMDEVGFKEYNSLLAYLCNTPFEIRVALYKEGVIYNTLSQWELFLNYFQNGNDEIMTKVFSLFLNIKYEEYVLVRDDGKFVLENVLNKHMIDEFKFLYITRILREMGGIGNSKEPTFGNNTALMYELKREKRRVGKGRNKSNTSLSSIISSIAWNTEVNIFTVWDLTIFRLYNGLKRKTKKDKYDSIMLGIYTGNVKSESINFEKESWFNK